MAAVVAVIEVVAEHEQVPSGDHQIKLDRGPRLSEIGAHRKARAVEFGPLDGGLGGGRPRPDQGPAVHLDASAVDAHAVPRQGQQALDDDGRRIPRMAEHHQLAATRGRCLAPQSLAGERP